MSGCSVLYFRVAALNTNTFCYIMIDDSITQMIDFFVSQKCRVLIQFLYVVR